MTLLPSSGTQQALAGALPAERLGALVDRFRIAALCDACPSILVAAITARCR